MVPLFERYIPLERELELVQTNGTKMRIILLTFLGVAVTAWTQAQVSFKDVTSEAGIDFVHNNGATGKKYLPETMGSGGAFIDYDDDGWLDLFLINGMDLIPRKGQHSFPVLYRNNQDGSFTDVTKEAGLQVEFYGMGVAAADYDNDGDSDLYVTALGPDRLFQNQGNGTFRDVSNRAGLGDPSYGTSAAFFDFDRDGNLDLFVANYVRWSEEQDLFCTLDGENKSYCTPEPYQGASPKLYRNLGDGSFTDVTESAGLLDHTNKGLGVAIFDYNGDSWPDIMMANDTQPNKLWENKKNGRFEEVGIIAGIAFSEDGVARGAMGIDAADYDHSGYPSVVIGNFSNEMISLYHNEQTGFFIDDAPTSTVGPASLLSLTFGCFFFDFDLDGFLDIYTANGHVEDEIAAVQKRVTYEQPPHLFRNIDGKRFLEVTAKMGEAFAAPRVGRGAAYGDYDNDGDLDVLLTTCNGPAKLFRNDGGNQKNWIAIELEGTQSNRDAIGAVVRVTAGGVTRTGVVKTGSSYCSQSQLRLTFGLGDLRQVESIEVEWPSGKMQPIRRASINKILQIKEDS